MNGLLIREHTQDELAESEVVGDNTYRLPDHFSAEDVIVDVGANIGAFAYACLLRGAGKIVCFEPEPGCFRMLEANARRWGGKAECHQKAVWRDSEGVSLCTRRMPLTAMHHTLSGKGSAPSVSLSDILSALPEVRLLKLDCEGSERPILDATKSLDGVEEVVGEIHYRMFNRGVAATDGWLRRRMRSLGFKHVEIVRDKNPEIVALFFAKRKA